ncbi:MAG: hypothetical protein V2I41_13575 [Pseudomonadales bacterium]|jgi:hypothetical protein|nr:hypothetical protein [Pseudomonadales bacterium]
MTTKIEEIQTRISEYQEQLEQEYERLRAEFVQQRQELAHRFVEIQQRHRIGVWRYLRNSRITVVLTAPLVYSGWVAFAALDTFVSLFQAICFPIYGIPKVSRSEYMVFDRADLPYLNLIEKFNCFYCSYGNGVSAYAREVSARTEQYWCPIKHARRLTDAHRNYPLFFEHGDGEAYRKGLERLRGQYAGANKKDEA